MRNPTRDQYALETNGDEPSGSDSGVLSAVKAGSWGQRAKLVRTVVRQHEKLSSLGGH